MPEKRRTLDILGAVDRPASDLEGTAVTADINRQRIIFLDVDGTLVNAANRVADSSLRAIRRARERGHLVYLCTGRSAADIHPALREVEFDGAITNGGAYATSGGEQVIAQTISRETIERVIAFCDALELPYFLQGDDRVYANARMRSLVGDFMRRAADNPDTIPIDIDAFADTSEADLSNLAKLVFASAPDGTIERARRELGDDVLVVLGSIDLPGGEDGEICAAGVTKGSAIALLLSHLEMTAEDAIGIGDSWNDVEMFQIVGRPIAMGNAHPELKKLAGEVTTSVEDDGVWNAFVQAELIAL